MKHQCIAAVVMLAFAVVAECGVVPVVYSAPEITVVQQNVAPKYVIPAPISYATHAVSHAAPVISYAAQHVAHAAPAIAYAAPVAYSVPVVIAHREAHYVAATRGAVHEAPLPGHAVNQHSLNVEAAPGTL